MVIRKAVVLCAGEGSRLRPLTLSRPKHLLPVAGKPMLGWALEAIQDAGIPQVALIVGHHAEAIQHYVGTGEAWGLQVDYVAQPLRLGLGHAVNQARKQVDDQPFLVYLGDNMLEHGIRGFVEALAQEPWDAALLLKSVDEPERFGVAEVDGQRIVRLLEKPQNPPSDLAIVGVYAFQPSVFDAIQKLEPSHRGELEITDAIQLLIDAGLRVRWSSVEGLWEDVGEPAALLRANRDWLLRSELRLAPNSAENCHVQGPVGIEAGTRAVNSRLLGPCRIGRNCVIENADLGPNVSIGDGCQVVHARLRDCIVQRNSVIAHLPCGLELSILGEGVEVQGSPSAQSRRPLSLLLGDMAHVKVW